MVEYQAIARVLRLGQTRNVRVVRYIMKDTVEGVSSKLCNVKLKPADIRSRNYSRNNYGSWDMRRLDGRMTKIRI